MRCVGESGYERLLPQLKGFEPMSTRIPDIGH